MKALIKKEALELAVPVLLLLAMVIAMWLVFPRFVEVLIQPAQDPVAVVLCTAGITGFVLALLQFHGERARRTQNYLAHRGTPTVHVFAAKITVGLFCTFALAFVPPLVFAIVQASTSPLAPILQWGRMTELAWIAAFGAPAYAIGTLCTQLHRKLVAEALFGVFGAAMVAILAVFSAISTDGSSPALRYVLIQLGVAAGLLALACLLFRRAIDPDVALPQPSYRALAAVGLVTFVVPVLLGYCAVQGGLLDALHGNYPIVHRAMEDGRFFAVRGTSDFKSIEVDAFGEVVPGALEHRFSAWHSSSGLPPVAGATIEGQAERRWSNLVFAPRSFRSVAVAPPSSPRLFSGHWTTLYDRNRYRSDDGEFLFEGYIDPRDGVLRFFVRPGSAAQTRAIPAVGFSFSDDAPFAITMRRPGGRFSADTEILASGLRSTGELAYVPAVLFDPRDDTLWRVDPLTRCATEIVEAIALPDRDSVVRLEWRDVPSTPPPNDVEFAGGAAFRASIERVVVGERGRYVWDGEQFASYAGPSFAERTAPPLDYEVTLADPDPVFTRVELRSKSDPTIVRKQEYAPRDLRDWALAAGAHVVALLRSPAGNTVSFFAPHRDGMLAMRDGDTLFANALLIGGNRAWLLVLSVVLAVLAARSIVKRLRARNVDCATTWAWAIAVLALGQPAAWLFLLLEPRASKSSKRVASEERRTSMLICDETTSVPSSVQGVA